MAFLLPFAEPGALKGVELTYSVFDPTYYIEVLHAEGGTPIRLVDAPGNCRADRVPPNPDPQSVSLAASLDRTQSAGDGLGVFFAESVKIRCD
jgi:ABC-type uncharacterized transport system substrate-binding protein